MHPFPSTHELQRCVGQTLEQVSLDPFQVQFRFNSMCISIQNTVEQIAPDGFAWRYDCKAADGPPLLLHRLIGKRVLSIAREDWQLALKFEDRSSLLLHSDPSNFEAGNIWFFEGERGLFVF